MNEQINNGGQSQQAARTCSDERPCINCYADQGDCLGPAPETIRSQAARVDEVTDEAVNRALSTFNVARNYDGDVVGVAMRKVLAEFATLSAQPAERQGEVLSWALRQGGVLADWCNVAGAALRALMGAYERRVRSDCGLDDLAKEPWRCAEYVQAEQALRSKPAPVVEFTHPAAPVGVPEMIVDLAECRKAGWNDGARAYRAGWNACRAEMLELAATPSAREVQA